MYINNKFFSRANVAHHKVLLFLKGHNTPSTKEDPAYEVLCNFSILFPEAAKIFMDRPHKDFIIFKNFWLQKKVLYQILKYAATTC